MPVLRSQKIQNPEKPIQLLRGPTGPPGAAVDEPEFPSGEDLSGHRVVYLSDGYLFYSDKDIENTTLTVIGVTKNAASSGDSVKIVPPGKILSEPSWNWSFPGIIFLGNTGQLTQNIPLSGKTVIIGKAVSATDMLISLDQNIKLI